MQIKDTIPALAVGLIATFGAAAAAHAQDVTYQIYQTSTVPIVPGEVSPLSITESGTITTNGTIGVLSSGDVVSWNLALTDASNPQYDVTLNPTNSGIPVFTGAALSATPKGLTFNYSDTGSEFAIQGFKDGFFSGYQYVCYSAGAGACASGDTIVPNYYATDGVLVSQSGTQNLNSGGGGGGGGTTHSAPEIDPASAMAAVTLLLGALAIARGSASRNPGLPVAH